MTKHMFTRRREFLRHALVGSAALVFPGSGVIGGAIAQSVAPASSRMAEGVPSATARGAALLRAVHQVIDYPRVLDDPLALPILGTEDSNALQSAADRQSRSLRAFVAMRSRYAEDRLAAAVERGVRQYVVLGAGLDTFAYRNPHADLGLKVFEVDHPATQGWKRTRLSTAGISIPPSLTFAPVDFETQTLGEQLLRAGFRFGQSAFFSLLGVVIYLTDSAVMETMRFVASGAPGSEIAFDFSLPAHRLSESARVSRENSIARMAALGEPWLTFFEPAELANSLQALGFGALHLLAPQDGNSAYFSQRADGLRVAASGHMMAARV